MQLAIPKHIRINGTHRIVLYVYAEAHIVDAFRLLLLVKIASADDSIIID